ncbi:hypothetical protein JQC92_06825 [Shewanella sp. 202IG2-18]|uniref:hypothetical protein n=1 Tax=Parashewanella hymeniacidonis TaxID=2807618 RepID=UPI001961687A|nr:hypothetical protein [Parashewanella hymeniacidonis]MBM7071756.1 hypothetical protein [Parashewanella hymeniacidonis]
MKKILLTGIVLAASFNLKAQELQPSEQQSKGTSTVGIGFQYGGALGYKLSYLDNRNIYFISAGLVGGAIGYQRVIDKDKMHTVGLALGSEVLVSEKGFGLLTYNYHFNTVDDAGWVFGVGAGVRREDLGGAFANLGKTDTHFVADINIGYRF